MALAAMIIPLVVSKAQYLTKLLQINSAGTEFETHTMPKPPLPIISPRVHAKCTGHSSSAAATPAAAAAADDDDDDDDDESSNAAATASSTCSNGEG